MRSAATEGGPYRPATRPGVRPSHARSAGPLPCARGSLELPAVAPHPRDGRADHARAVADLAARLPEPIRPLAATAYDLRWSWIPRWRDVFAALDPERFGAVAANPVRFLRGLPVSRLEAASADPAIVERARGLAEELEADAEPPDGRPVAFLCAEFGVHASLPT